MILSTFVVTELQREWESGKKMLVFKVIITSESHSPKSDIGVNNWKAWIISVYFVFYHYSLRCIDFFRFSWIHDSLNSTSVVTELGCEWENCKKMLVFKVFNTFGSHSPKSDIVVNNWKAWIIEAKWKSVTFPYRELNPGRLGENQKS